MTNYKKIGSYALKGIGILIAFFVIALLVDRLVTQPKEARKECAELAWRAASEQRGLTAEQAAYDFYFRSCLDRKGLKE